MNSHKNARLTPLGRALLVDRVLVQGVSVSAAADAAGVSRRTARKWIKRYEEEGPAGLLDRSSRGHAMEGCPDERPRNHQACQERP